MQFPKSVKLELMWDKKRHTAVYLSSLTNDEFTRSHFLRSYPTKYYWLFCFSGTVSWLHKIHCSKRMLLWPLLMRNAEWGWCDGIKNLLFLTLYFEEHVNLLFMLMVGWTWPSSHYKWLIHKPSSLSNLPFPGSFHRKEATGALQGKKNPKCCE